MSIHHGKTSIQGRQALYGKLEKGDKVALEAGSEVRVLNSAKLPLVPLPGEQEMERRKTLASYGREVRNRTKMINTLHAMFVHQGHTTVVKKDLATAERRRQAVGVLTGHEREDAEYILKHLELHEQRMDELKKKIKTEAKTDEGMKRLQSVAGVGPIVAYAYVAHVGDGSRFSTGAQVSNYLGFVPRLDYSGTIQRHGHITKRGNGYLRGLLVQAARSAVRSKSGGAGYGQEEDHSFDRPLSGGTDVLGIEE